MDSGTHDQLFSEDLLFNPPLQMPSTSGVIGQQEACWRLMYTLPPGHEHSSLVNHESGFLQPVPALNILAEAVPVEQNTFELFRDGDIGIRQRTDLSVPSGTGNCYEPLEPLYNESAILGHVTGVHIPGGIGILDPYVLQPLDLNVNDPFQSSEVDTRRPAHLLEPIEQVPDAYLNYLDIKTKLASHNSNDPLTWFFSAASNSQGQQLPLEDLTMNALSTLPQATPQAVWESIETTYEDFNHFQAMHDSFRPYHVQMSDTTIEQQGHLLQRDSMVAAVSDNNNQKDTSAAQGKSPTQTDIRVKKHKQPDIESKAKRLCIPGIKESDGTMHVFSSSNNSSSEGASLSTPQLPLKKVACYLCRCRQRKCEGSGAMCDLCTNSGHTCIKNPEPFAHTDLLMANKIGHSQRLNCPLSSPRILNASIFVCTPPCVHITPLCCSFIFRHVGMKSLQEKMSESCNWDSMLSTGRESVKWELRAPCIIPILNKPSHKTIQKWALESLEADSATSFGSLHEQVFHLATEYLQSPKRPLHSLVSLTQKYAAIYSVCNSKLSMLLETRNEQPCEVSRWLRAQICGPVLRVLGAKVEKGLKKADVTSLRHTGESALALRIVLWFLMLLYQHSDARGRKVAWLHAEPEGISSEGILKKRQKLGRSLRFICDLYDKSFIQPTGSICPIFDEDFLPEHGTDDQKKKLHILIANLRVSMQQYVKDSPSTNEESELCIIKLISSIQKIKWPRGSNGGQVSSTIEFSMSAAVGSEPDDLNLGKCSIVEQVRREGDGIPPSRDIGTTRSKEKSKQKSLQSSERYASLKFNLAFHKFSMIEGALPEGDIQPSTPSEYLWIPELEDALETSEEGQENEHNVLYNLANLVD